MGLVKGFTDILTPVNLLPNSDFSRGGGLASTLTYSEIPDNYGNYNCPCAEGKYIQLSTGCDKLTNVTVTRSTGKINIKGTIGTVHSGSEYAAWIRIRCDGSTGNYTLSAIKGQYYTVYGRIKDNIKNTSICSMAVGDTDYSSRTIVLNENKQNDSVFIFLPGGKISIYTSVYLFGYSSGESFDIDFYSVQFYEGAFVNPPVLESLDVKSTNQFVLEQASQEYFYQNQGVPSQSYVFNNYTNGSNTYEIESLKCAQRTSVSGAQHAHFKCKCYLTTVFGNAGGAFHNRNNLFVWDCYLSMDGTGNIVQNCDLTTTSQLSYISNPTLSMSGLNPSGGTLKFTLSFTHGNYIYSNNHYVFMIIPELMLPAENYEFIFPVTPISAKKLTS